MIIFISNDFVLFIGRLPLNKNIVTILIAISVIGIFGIPLGDPKFITEAIALESSYIALTVLSIKKIKYTLIPSIIIACIVIAGNTLSPKHVGIMLSLNPLYNAIILIVGGYILQGLLLVTNIVAYRNMKHLVIRDSN
jgi:hypothetical protein